MEDIGILVARLSLFDSLGPRHSLFESIDYPFETHFHRKKGNYP